MAWYEFRKEDDMAVKEERRDILEKGGEGRKVMEV